MMIIYNRTPQIATAVGCLLLTASTAMNVSAALDGGQPLFSPTTFGIVALVIGQATAIRAGQSAWRRKLRGRALLAFLALGCAELYGLYIGGERLLAARERQAQPIAKLNQAFDVAERRVRFAEAEYRKADEAATAETRHGGCGRVCRDLRATADRAQEELEAARTALAHTPPKRPESIVVSVTGWPAALVEIAPALLFTLGLNGMAFALLSIGEAVAEPVQRRMMNSAGTRRRGARKTRVQNRPRRRTRSAQVANFCEAFRAKHGREPTFTEVRLGTKLAKSTVSSALGQLNRTAS